MSSYLSCNLASAHGIRDPELGVSSLNNGQSSVRTIEAVLVRVLVDIVVGTEAPLHEAHMVGGDVRGDSDHLTRLVSPHNDTIGKLATGSLVFLDCCIPRVATDPTFTYIT